MQENTGGFPSEFDDPKKKKQDSWGLRYAQETWATANNESFGYSFQNNRELWIRNRKFAEGLHDLAPYKSRALPSETEYIALDYSANTPAPKIIRTVIQNILDHPYKPNVTLYDSHSHSKLEQKKNELLGKMFLKNEMQKLKAEGIIPEGIDFPQLQSVPKDAEEVEMYMTTNAKLIEAIAIEKLVSLSFKNNKVSTRIDPKIVEDLVKIKMSAVYCGVNSDYKFEIKHVDPVKLVTSWVQTDDFSDLKHVGHWEDITASEFRRRAQGKFSDKQIFEMVKTSPANSGNFGAGFANLEYFQLSDQQRRQIEGAMVRIFCFETLQSDRKTYVEKDGEEGYLHFYERSADYKASDENKKVTKGVINKIYKGVWVVDSPYMLEWGLKPNVIRKIRNGKFEEVPCFSYIIRQPNQYEMKNKSMVEELIPHIEQMIILTIKMQHFIAIASPPGVFVDTASVSAAIQGMGMDGLKPLDMDEIRRQIGTVYYSSVREDGMPITNTVPVGHIPSTLDGSVSLLAELWNFELDKINQISGMNSAVDSTNPDPKRLKSVNLMAKQAFNTSIGGLQSSYLSMMEEIAERAAYAQQMAIQAGRETEEVKELLSTPEMKVLQAVEVGEINFNLKLEMLPDQQEKDSLYIDIQTALQQGALGVEDAMMIKRVMNESTEKAEVILAERIRKRQKQAQEAELARIQAQQQVDAALIQETQKKEDYLAQLKERLELAKKDMEIEKVREEEAEKRKTLAVKIDGDKELLELAHKLEMQKEATGMGYNSEKNTMPKVMGGEPNIQPRT